jgi:hypothetical protein
VQPVALHTLCRTVADVAGVRVSTLHAVLDALYRVCSME